MRDYMILFSVGKDRPGIVERVSTFLFEHGANIQDSHMAAMGGRFSIMTLFSCEPKDSESIRNDLSLLEAGGLFASLHDAEDPAAGLGQAMMPFCVDVRAMDYPGIVRKVVKVLHRFEINILSLNTRVNRAPLSGTDLFDLSIEAAVPVGKRITEVKEALLELAAEMDLDLSFRK